MNESDIATAKVVRTLLIAETIAILRFSLLPSPFYPQPSALSPQPSTLSPQPSALCPLPPASCLLPSAFYSCRHKG